ncbi:DNA polymerase III delta prime subunit [Saccharothrix ecbatanensis]|uniref:DNA polymerase III delta prime subunit n=1 Tax=Saccharothrix ecbatanensis TaxID=1105145 RepID=A0A7W9HTL2_9PSEU|nr:restriction endonuclease [Saccharothrix ecbatanensis]MBB5808204.1 DNA polymerase III delta prime subunit [Saccharothrix ecbatanensis]
MDSFELGRLTDFDFEAVCHDLFEEILNVRLELFSPGADDGVDLRHYTAVGGKLVIQCKHWIRSGRSALKRHMRDVELVKIDSLAPDRYILVTSAELTKKFKDDLFQLLKPHVAEPGDIYGLHDIEAELRKRPELVRKHLRLWLSSTAVLQALLNKSVLVRSGFLREELEESLRVYAPSKGFHTAQELLESYGVCIIAGPPGVGKTILAKVLSAAYVANGYEIVEVSSDVEELFQSWDEDVPQVFYYDDFLGQTTLEDKLHKNEASRLVAAMRKVSRSPNKRFILTTREYILVQARQRYEVLSRHDLELHKCVLDLAEYSKLIRAEILYNHIYHSVLDPAEKANFARPAVYRPIVNHRLFNPRLVAHSIQIAKVGEASEGIAQAVLGNLNDPQRIWGHMVEYDLDDSALHVLEMLFSFGGSTALADLEIAWSAYRCELGQVDDARRFRRAVDILENTMIRTSAPFGEIQVFFHNPSVRDFMVGYIGRQAKVIEHIIASVEYYEQIVNIWTVANGRAGSQLFDRIARLPSVLEQAILRTFESEPSPGRPHASWSTRAGATLAIASAFNLERIGELMQSHLRDEEWIWNVDDHEEIASLANAVHKCTLSSVIEIRDSVIEQACQHICNSVHDWATARRAMGILAQIGGGASEVYISQVESERREYMEAEFASWVGGDEPGYVDWSNLDEMIDEADFHFNPEGDFPGFTEAREALAVHRENTTVPEVDINVQEREDVSRDDRVVDHLMGLLRQQSR